MPKIVGYWFSRIEQHLFFTPPEDCTVWIEAFTAYIAFPLEKEKEYLKMIKRSAYLNMVSTDVKWDRNGESDITEEEWQKRLKDYRETCDYMTLHRIKQDNSKLEKLLDEYR